MNIGDRVRYNDAPGTNSGDIHERFRAGHTGTVYRVGTTARSCDVRWDEPHPIRNDYPEDHQNVLIANLTLIPTEGTLMATRTRADGTTIDIVTNREYLVLAGIGDLEFMSLDTRSVHMNTTGGRPLRVRIDRVDTGFETGRTQNVHYYAIGSEGSGWCHWEYLMDTAGQTLAAPAIVAPTVTVEGVTYVREDVVAKDLQHMTSTLHSRAQRHSLCSVYDETQQEVDAGTEYLKMGSRLTNYTVTVRTTLVVDRVIPVENQASEQAAIAAAQRVAQDYELREVSVRRTGERNRIVSQTIGALSAAPLP